jgi:hypothetical protein
MIVLMTATSPDVNGDIDNLDDSDVLYVLYVSDDCDVHDLLNVRDACQTRFSLSPRRIPHNIFADLTKRLGSQQCSPASV